MARSPAAVALLLCLSAHVSAVPRGVLSPPAPEPQTRRLQASAATAQALAATGTPVNGNVATAGAQDWYSFTANAGSSYQIGTQLTTLDDTMVDLVDTDQSTIIIENVSAGIPTPTQLALRPPCWPRASRAAPRPRLAPPLAASSGASAPLRTPPLLCLWVRSYRDSPLPLRSQDDDARAGSNSLASYIEWTCPASGTYYIMIKGYGRSMGTFTVSVTQGGVGGGVGGDPCAGGVRAQVSHRRCSSFFNRHSSFFNRKSSFFNGESSFFNTIRRFQMEKSSSSNRTYAPLSPQSPPPQLRLHDSP